VSAALSALLDLAGSDSCRGLSELATQSIIKARLTLELLARSEDLPITHFACTLISVVGRSRKVCAAHVGDGGVVVRRVDGLHLLSPPAVSEYVNEVDPLTGDGWREGLRVSPVIDQVESIAVFTDGCQRAALRREDELRPYPGFFDPLFAYARRISRLRDGQRDLRELLRCKKMSEHSDDDKTLVLAVLSF